MRSQKQNNSDEPSLQVLHRFLKQGVNNHFYDQRLPYALGLVDAALVKSKAIMMDNPTEKNREYFSQINSFAAHYTERYARSGTKIDVELLKCSYRHLLKHYRTLSEPSPSLDFKLTMMACEIAIEGQDPKWIQKSYRIISEKMFEPYTINSSEDEKRRNAIELKFTEVLALRD